MIEYKNIFLSKIAHYLPSNVVTNEQLIQDEGLKMKSSWVESRLGISQRRWVGEGETTSDLVVNSLRKLEGQEAPLFLSTISPDYLTPSTASEVKRKMQWTGECIAVDLAAACAGFIFAIEQAATMATVASLKLVYASAGEVRSRFLNKKDRRTVFLFGDAGVACSLTTQKSQSLAQLKWTHCSTQSFGEPEILIPAGGAKKELTQADFESGENKIRMVDGVAITQAVEQRLVDAVQSCLKMRNEKIQDYSHFAFHQGNGQLIRHVLSQLGANEDQTLINFGEYGNSSSASVGVVFSQMVEQNRIKSGQKILLVAMGAGYHLGLASLRWE